MSERFVEFDETSQTAELSAEVLLDEVASIDNQRRDTGRVVDAVEGINIDEALAMIRHELSPDGAVVGTITVLESSIKVIEKQLAILASIEARIDVKRKEPLRIRDLATQVMDEIDELRTELTQQIQNLQAQKNTTSVREKINNLASEKTFKRAAEYAAAMDARTHANADLRRLNDPASIVANEKRARMNILGEYRAEVQVLKARVETVSVIMGKYASILAEVKIIAHDPYVVSDLPLPGRLPDIKLDTVARSVSYDDNLPFAMNAEIVSDWHSPESPANVNDFPDVISIDAAYIHTVPEEAKQPDSLHPLLSKAVLEARKAPLVPKKSKRIRGFLRIN